jgi:ribose 1,5-bisphosphokinase PhnN
MDGKTLVVVDGPSGAGKSYLLRWASGRYDHVVAIAKLTTRPARDGESGGGWSDLIHVSAGEFAGQRLDYVYSWNGHRYGFSRAQLAERLSDGGVGLLVVRDAATIRRLARELTDVRVSPVFVDADATVRRRRLLEDGMPPEDVDHRLAIDRPAGHGGLYRCRIVNDGPLQDFREKIAGLIEGIER